MVLLCHDERCDARRDQACGRLCSMRYVFLSKSTNKEPGCPCADTPTQSVINCEHDITTRVQSQTSAGRPSHHPPKTASRAQTRRPGRATKHTCFRAPTLPGFPATNLTYSSSKIESALHRDGNASFGWASGGGSVTTVAGCTCRSGSRLLAGSGSDTSSGPLVTAVAAVLRRRKRANARRSVSRRVAPQWYRRRRAGSWRELFLANPTRRLPSALPLLPPALPPASQPAGTTTTADGLVHPPVDASSTRLTSSSNTRNAWDSAAIESRRWKKRALDDGVRSIAARHRRRDATRASSLASVERRWLPSMESVDRVREEPTLQLPAVWRSGVEAIRKGASTSGSAVAGLGGFGGSGGRVDGERGLTLR